jgi:hypothetical protein
MNTNMIQSLARSVLLAAGAGLVTNGTVSASQEQQLVGAIITAGSIIWSQYFHLKNPPPPAPPAAGN